MEKSKSPLTEKRIPTEKRPVPAREPPRPGTARIVRRLEPRPTESSRKWRLIHRSSGSTRGDTCRGDTCNSKAPRIRSAAPGRIVSQDRKASGSGIDPDYASKSGPGSVRPSVVRGDFLRRCQAFPLRSARTVEWRSIIGRPAGRRTSSSSGTRAGWSGRRGSAAPFPQIQGRIPRPILTDALGNARSPPSRALDISPTPTRIGLRNTSTRIQVTGQSVEVEIVARCRPGPSRRQQGGRRRPGPGKRGRRRSPDRRGPGFRQPGPPATSAPAGRYPAGPPRSRRTDRGARPGPVRRREP